MYYYVDNLNYKKENKIRKYNSERILLPKILKNNNINNIKLNCFKKSKNNYIINYTVVNNINTNNSNNTNNINNKEIVKKRKQSVKQSGNKSKWNKIKILLDSIIKLYKYKATKINTIKNLKEELQIESFKINNKISHNNMIKDKINDIYKEYFELIQIGGSNNIKIIDNIIRNDTSNNLFSKLDRNHIINKLNQNGESGVFIACKNGDYPLLKYFISKNCILDNTCNIHNKSLLSIATFWNYYDIIILLLEHNIYTQKDLKHCIQISNNKRIINILKSKLKKSCCLFN